MKVTARDIKFFFLGVLSLFLIESILGWNDTLKEIKKGYMEGYNAANK